jgi:hypothetical protein
MGAAVIQGIMPGYCSGGSVCRGGFAQAAEWCKFPRAFRGLAMELGATAIYIISGTILIAIGYICREIASRYDFKEILLCSAWQLMRGKRTAATPTDIEARFGEITSAPTHFGKARQLGTNVAGHFIAPVLGLIGLLFIVGGLVLYWLAYYLR